MPCQSRLDLPGVARHLRGKYTPTLAVSVFVGCAHHQFAVAHPHAQRAADGKAKFLHPASAQAQRGRALAAGGVAAADGARLRRARAAARAWRADQLSGEEGLAVLLHANSFRSSTRDLSILM